MTSIFENSKYYLDVLLSSMLFAYVHQINGKFNWQIYEVYFDFGL